MRIRVDESINQMIDTLSEGDSDAKVILNNLVKGVESIDSTPAICYLYQLDSIGMYGIDIFYFYQCVCDGSFPLFIFMLRCKQYDILTDAEYKDSMDTAILTSNIDYMRSSLATKQLNLNYEVIDSEIRKYKSTFPSYNQ